MKRFNYPRKKKKALKKELCNGSLAGQLVYHTKVSAAVSSKMDAVINILNGVSTPPLFEYFDKCMKEEVQNLNTNGNYYS